MAKRKDQPKRYPSRENIRYVGIPLAMYELLETLGDEQERSTAYVVKKIIQAHLEQKGLWPPKPE